MNKFEAKLKSIEHLSPDVLHYEFEYLGSAVDFKPGQFFLLEIADGKKPICNRSYSLASAPREGGFALCIKLVEGGRASEYFKSLHGGETMKFSGPYGHFTLKDDEKDVVMIATGTGIAPFLSMLPGLLESKDERSVDLFFGTSKESRLIYSELLRAWEKEHDRFLYYPTVSRPSEDWTGHRGRVQEHLLKAPLDLENSRFYICGIGEMVVDVRALLLGMGVPKEQIHFELYSPVKKK